MSAIGDYVHLHAKNYDKYGIAQVGEDPSFMSYTQQKNNIKNRINNSVLGKKGTEELQTALGKILSTEDTSEEVQGIQKIVEEMLAEQYGAALGRIDWDTGNITQGTNKYGMEVQKKIETDLKAKAVQLKTILTRIAQLEQLRMSIPNAKDKAELKKKIDEIYNMLNEIVREGSYGVKGQLQSIARAKGGVDFSNSKLSNRNLAKTKELKSVITEINDVIKQFGATPPINLEKGDLFEALIAVAPLVAKKAAGKTADELIKQSVQGAARSKNKIDLSNWSDQIDLNSLAFKGMHREGGVGSMFVANMPTQDKIDVEMVWENEVVPISAKNVNLKSGNDVHIVSGTNLLYLLQDEGDFTTHFMNVIATHEDGNVKGLQEAHEAAKLTILYKALTGDTYGHNRKAEIFLVNDNSQEGGVRIFEMKDLIQKASEHIDSFANFKFEPSLILRNRYEKSGYGARITNLVQQMHQIKVSAAIKASNLK